VLTNEVLTIKSERKTETKDEDRLFSERLRPTRTAIPLEDVDEEGALG
jgi:hypothetical protein